MWEMRPEIMSRRTWFWLAFAKKLIENMCLVIRYYGKDCIRGVEQLYHT